MAHVYLVLGRMGFALAVALNLVGCSGPEALDSSRVDPDAVWAKYMLEYDADTQSLRAAAQFRLKNESGAVIRLKEPSAVVIDGAAMGLSSSQSAGLALNGNFYSLNLAAAAPNQQFTFTWIRPDSKKVTNSVARVPELRFRNDSIPLKQSRRTQLNVLLDSWDAVSSDVVVTCRLESRVADAPAEQLTKAIPPDARQPGVGLPPGSGAGSGVGTVIGAPTPSPTPSPSAAGSSGAGPADPQNPSTEADVQELSFRVPFGSSCVFAASQLQKFRRGPAKLRLLSEKTDTAVTGHPKGGVLISRSWGPAGLLDIDD